MMVEAGGTPDALEQELQRLNDRQREAARTEGNVACMAGPGSGKTRALVARVAYTMKVAANPRERLAAITYTRAAAAEIVERLEKLGVYDRSRVRVGTLHSFCLQDVLIRHQELLGIDLSKGNLVLTAEEQSEWETDAEIRHEIYDGRTPNGPANIVARRALAVDEGWDRLDPKRLLAVRDFERQLLESGRFDNEQIVISSYRALREQPKLARLLAARFPYLLVDEYQDLGPVLHRIVLLLLDAGVRVFAVGDPDQSVMGFTGANPRYFLELAERSDFKRLDFEINYRSGSAIIAASHRILRESRPHFADPIRPDPGIVRNISVEGDQQDHATATVDVIAQLREDGLAYSDIAILYPQRGPVVDAVVQAVEQAGTPIRKERSLTTLRGPLGEFVQSCGRRSLAGHQPGSGEQTAVPIPLLVRQLQTLTLTLTGEAFGLNEERRIVRALSATLAKSTVGLGAAEFLRQLSYDLDLQRLMSSTRALEDALVDLEGASMEDLAGQGTNDAIVVTTYASAKGRQFKAVILPGCIEGLIPRWEMAAGFKQVPPSRRQLAMSRAAFYVAFTRAEDQVIMISGRYWSNRGGFANGQGYSRFVYEALGNGHPFFEPSA